MDPHRPSEQPDRTLVEVEDAICAEIDAERAVREEIGDPPPQLGGIREEGDDPFGTNWAWTSVPTQFLTSTDQPVPTLLVEDKRRSFRKAGYALLAATAACLLIALGMLLSAYFRNSGSESFALNVEPTTIQFLGPQQPQPTVTSTNSGFISAIAITAKGEVNIWPTVGDRPGKAVIIRKGEAVRVGPMSVDVEFIMVVVTEQPATLTLIEEFGQSKIPPDQWPGMEQRITAALRNQNYRNLAVGRAQYPPVP